ncbi:MAG: YcgN family cysteine cluster protein [Gammaproteobacteria bacterium]|nr:YcgN family cysteine cluster protein [Gammaproteobacteria bacterium]
MTELAFWKKKSLKEMSEQEWESLCDGCARCCLHKLEEHDTGKIFYTNVACHLLDLKNCRCTDYVHRHQRVTQCIRIPVDGGANLHWMPSNCAYRLLAEGRDLPDWHPLVSGDPRSVHKAGISIRYMAVPKRAGMDLESHVVSGD